MKSFHVPSLMLVLALFFANAAFAGPVSNFGELYVCGSDICGKKTGDKVPVLLKGPSLFWSDGDGAPFYTAETIDWLVENMKISVFRAAMMIGYYDSDGGTSSPANKGQVHGYSYDPATQKSLMNAVIKAAIDNDIYVLVDWHSHRAQNEINDAKAFFVEMANAYKNTPNIIWEIYNEPPNISTDQVKSYANTIISALRDAGNNNLILIGSPSWTAKPADQAGTFGTSTAKDKNLAFTFHFYAGSDAHTFGNSIGTNTKKAKTDGYAVFGSEWSGVTYDGDGSFNTSKADEWITWMEQNKVGGCMWSASNAKKTNDINTVQASSMFIKEADSKALKMTDFTSGSGEYFKTYMGKSSWTDIVPSTHPKGNNVYVSVKDGASVELKTQLGLDGDITKVGEVAFGTLKIADDKKSITYTTPASGSESGKVKFNYEVTKGSVTIQSKVVITITDRLPIVPQKNPINVSRKVPTTLNITSNLSVSDPGGGQGAEFFQVKIIPENVGTATINASKTTELTFTPDASMADAPKTEAKLEYTVKSKSTGATNTGTVTLNIQNFAPTIRPLGSTYAPSYPNTDKVGIGLKGLFSGVDKDGDKIWFDTVYLDKQYPGTWEFANEDKDSIVYTPAAGKTGKVTFLAIATDGTAKSSTGQLNINLTGSGEAINVTPPTSIPGIVDPEPEPPDPITAYPQGAAKGMGLLALGSGKIQLYFAQNGFAKLDVYSLSGKKMGSLLSGNQNIGSQEVSLKSLNLQKGVYILRLSQGSQVKTLRVVN